MSSPTLTDASISVSAGVTALAWTRPIVATGDASELPLTPTGADGYVWAAGSGPSSDVLGYHGDSRGFFELALVPSSCDASTTCSGHGACGAASGGCVCAAGWARDDCSECAPGFAASGAGACAPDASAPTTSAVVTLTLTSAYVSCCIPGTGARTTYIAALEAGIARVLALAPARVAVTGLSPGGGSDESGVIATLALAAGSSPTTPAATVDLAAQWANSSSPLYKDMSATVDATVPPAFAYTAPPPATYAFTHALDGALTLSWSLDAGAGTLALRLVCGNGVKWCSVGVNGDAAMVGADIVAYEAGRAAGAQVNQYTLTAKSAAGVVAVPAAQSNIADALASVAPDGTVTVSWTRPLAAGAYAGARAVPAAGSTSVIWASGAPPLIARHDDDAAGAATINFASGAFSTDASAAAMRIAHGALMFAAWAVLAPAGVFLARFAKRVPPSSGPRAFWFVSHYMVQSAALAAAAAGLGLAVAFSWGGAHFDSAHGKLGLAVFVAGALQPVNAFVRPLRGKPGSPYTTARLLWEILHKGAGYATLAAAAAAIVLGLLAYGAPTPLIAAYGALAAATVAAFAAFAARDAAVAEAHTLAGKTSGAAASYFGSFYAALSPRTALTPKMKERLLDDDDAGFAQPAIN